MTENYKRRQDGGTVPMDMRIYQALSDKIAIAATSHKRKPVMKLRYRTSTFVCHDCKLIERALSDGHVTTFSTGRV